MADRHHRFRPLGCQPKRFGLTPESWALLIFSLAVGLSRFLMLSHSPFANGLDGYYYAEQILSLHKLGHFIIVDNSPVLYLMGGLDFLVNKPIVSAKLASALFGAWLCLAAYYCVGSLGGDSGQSLAAALLLGISPTLTFMSVDYIKNCGALVVLLISIGVAAKCLAGAKPTPWRFLLVLLAFGLCFSAHRVSAVAFSLFALALLAQKGRAWLVGSLVALLAGLGAVALLSHIKGGFLLSDLGRVVPAFAPGQGLALLSETFRQGLPWPVVAELSLAALLMPPLAMAWQRMPQAWRSLWLCALPLFLPIWDLSSLDLGFRLQSNGVVILLMLLVLALPKIRAAWLPLGLAISLALLPLEQSLYRLETDPPFKLYQKVVDGLDLPADSLLICHPGLNNFYTYSHGLKDALAFLPEFPVAREKLWRLSYGISMAEYRQGIPQALAAGLVQRRAGQYVLIREDAFQEFMGGIDPERRSDINNWYNPHELRPQFLIDKNR